MCKILIFGGTTEGRQLAEFCAEHRISAYVSSATDYGTGLIKKSGYITKLTGRMNTEEMESFILSKKLRLVIDVIKQTCQQILNIIAPYNAIFTELVNMLFNKLDYRVHVILRIAEET